MILLVNFFVNIILITSCVFVHYQIFIYLSSILTRSNIQHRTKVFWAMITVMMAHIIEIWIFAIAYYLCSKHEIFGHLSGNIGSEFLDYVYYSFVIYTSLGLGDVVPEGNLRFTSGIEALVGLVLIAWSASYMFFQMQKYWQDN